MSRSRPLAVPLGDAGTLRVPVRRATAVRLGLAALAIALVGLAVALAREPEPRLGSLVEGTEATVVVLDVSASVSDLVYQEIARTLQGIVDESDDSTRVGLVLFSDAAAEALPPGTPVDELRPFIRFFRPKSEPSASRKPSYYRAAGPTTAGPTIYPQNPWFRSFSGGTRIAGGLEAARVALAREGYAGGRVLLLSDLAEAEDDSPRLTGELVRYARDPALDLRIVALPPATEAETGFFERILGGPSAIVTSRELHDAGEGGAGAFPTWLAVAIAALAAVLAAYELLARPLTWRRA